MKLKIIKASSFVLMLLLTVEVLELASYLTTANAKDSPTGRTLFVNLPKTNNNIKLYDQQIYAYSSTIDQTDFSPFLTASQSKVRVGIIANNCYPFGTRVRINGKNYTVEDRLNSRYGCEVWDKWYETKQEALNWGVRYLEVIILDN